MVTIQNPSNIALPSHASEILAKLYSAYDEIYLIKALTDGLSTSLLYLIRPILLNQGELANVVKIDVSEQIELESIAFERHIQGQLPNSVHLISGPVFSADQLWGGIRLELVGSGYFSIQSLYDYVHEATSQRIYSLLKERLFHGMGAFWKQHHSQPQFRPGIAYDSMLPPNLVLEQTESSESAFTLAPNVTFSQEVTPGTLLYISGFQVTKRDPVRKRLTLNLPDNSFRSSFEFKLYHPDPLSFHPKQIVNLPRKYVVRDTRMSLLSKIVQKSIGSQYTELDRPLLHPSGQELPNPLAKLPDLMQYSFDAYISKIHGDLNLQNVLVDSENGTVFVIDFPYAQFNHVLLDLLHMEMNIVNQLLAKLMAEQMIAAPFITNIYNALHLHFTEGSQLTFPSALEKPMVMLKAIREAASNLLYEKEKWDEYYICLAIYLIGSLRFGNLDHLSITPLPKQLAFWGSASLLNLHRTKNRGTDYTTGSQNPPLRNHYRVQSNRPYSGSQQTGTYMSNDNITNSALSQVERQNALSRILGLAAKRSAKLLMYGSCLGAIALMPENTIPATLIGLATGIGVNNLASLIERVARGHETSDVEISNQLESVVAESNFEQIISDNHIILTEIRQLRVWQDQIKLFIQSNNEHVIELMTNYDTSITTLQTEFEEIQVDIRKIQKALSYKDINSQTGDANFANDVLIKTGDVRGEDVILTGAIGAQSGQGRTTISTENIEAQRNVNITGWKSSE